MGRVKDAYIDYLNLQETIAVVHEASVACERLDLEARDRAIEEAIRRLFMVLEPQERSKLWMNLRYGKSSILG